MKLTMVKWLMAAAVAFATGASLPAWGEEAFVSSPFRLDMRIENGKRVAESVEIIQASAAWAGGSGDTVAKVRHTPPGGEAETLHTTTSAGTESFAWDALHSVTGDHVFVHTIWRGGAQVDTMSVTFTVPDPTLNAVRIFGPTNFYSGNTAQYTCMGYFSDDSGRQVLPVWSLVEPMAGVSIDQNGVLSADESATAKSVTMRAVAELNGHIATNELAVTIAAAYLSFGQQRPRLYLESTASEASVRVSCSGVWTAESSEDWLVVSEGAGTGDGLFVLSCGKNPSEDDRNAIVTVRCGTLTQTMRVMQYGGEPETRVTVAFDAQGGTATYGEHEYVVGEKYGTLPYATKAGKVFGGWWTQTGGQGMRVLASTEATAAVTVLYAYWRDMEAKDALDNALDWMGDGDADWVIDETESKMGGSSMRSGVIGRQKVSTIFTEVTGPGTISFWWRTSCSEDDCLVFYDNGNYINLNYEIYGETGWLHQEYTISDEGTHYISWSYEKYTRTGEGRDCGWLDGVVWMPDFASGEGIGGQGVGEHAVPAAWKSMYGITAETSADDDSDGDGMTDFEEYIVGSNPTDPESKFTVSITMEGGTPVLEPSPYLGEGQRTYTIEGKANLNDPNWEPADNSKHRFFRAKVELK